MTHITSVLWVIREYGPSSFTIPLAVLSSDTGGVGGF